MKVQIPMRHPLQEHISTSRDPAQGPCAQGQPLIISVPISREDHILANTPVVLLRPEQPVQKEDGRRPVRVIRYGLGRLVEVVGQGHGLDRRGAIRGRAMCHKGPQVYTAAGRMPCAHSQQHSSSQTFSRKMTDGACVWKGCWMLRKSQENEDERVHGPPATPVSLECDPRTGDGRIRLQGESDCSECSCWSIVSMYAAFQS